jgi:hypothetical protein
MKRSSQRPVARAGQRGITPGWRRVSVGTAGAGGGTSTPFGQWDFTQSTQSAHILTAGFY